MGTTTFSGPVRVGQAQKTTNPQVAGAVRLVAQGYIPDPTVATTTNIRRGPLATGPGSLPLILPANAIITRVEGIASATGGTNPTFDLGWIEVKDTAPASDPDGILDNADADVGNFEISFTDATSGNDMGYTMSSTHPVRITGGVGAAAATGGNIELRIFYHVYDVTYGTDGSGS
tara:strand:- start:139 stop:663 length:525 start_codon:yes stop_codon:yes gene_type:complete